MVAKRSGDVVAEIKKLSAFPSLMLVLSTDRIRKERFFKFCLEHFFKSNQAPELRRFDAAELDQRKLTALQDELHAQSLFSKREIFLIQGCEQLDANSYKSLSKILESTSLASDVVLWSEPLAATHALKKLCVARDALFEFPDLKGLELKRWVARELKLVGITEPSDGCVDLLIGLSGDSLDRLHTLCEHCGLYADDGKLTLQDLHRLFVEQIEPSEFELIDTLQSPNRARIELLLKQTMDCGKSPFALIGLISRVFANYLSIKFLLNQGKTPHEIKAELGLNPWVLNKTIPVVKKYQIAKLAQIQREILRADSKLKNKSLGADLVLSQLLSELRA